MASAGTGAPRPCDQCGAPAPQAGRIIVLGASSGAASYERVYCSPECLTLALRAASGRANAWPASPTAARD